MYKAHTSQTHIKSLVMINQSLQFLEINEDHYHEQGVYICSTELCPGVSCTYM